MKTEPCLCGDPECPRCFPQTLEMPVTKYSCDACGIIMEAAVMEDLPCGEDGDCPHVWNPVESKPNTPGIHLILSGGRGVIYGYVCEMCSKQFDETAKELPTPVVCNGCFRGRTGVSALILEIPNANSEETKPTAS